jgi:hypothetical protein
MHRGLYYLVTLSLFDSKYKGSDGIEHSTVFDGKYVFNALGGKEFKLNSSGKSKKFITSDIKLTAAGGQRYTPIDKVASVKQEKTVYLNDLAYTEHFKDYFRLDLRVAYRIDYSKYSHEIAFYCQNITNHKNPLYMQYNKKTGNLDTIYQLMIFPMMQYKLTF